MKKETVDFLITPLGIMNPGRLSCWYEILMTSKSRDAACKFHGSTRVHFFVWICYGIMVLKVARWLDWYTRFLPFSSIMIWLLQHFMSTTTLEKCGLNYEKVWHLIKVNTFLL